MEDYKQEIRDTRLGCLGSSDASILKQIATNGTIPKSAYKRLAIVKGLIPQKDIPMTDAIRLGNEMEMEIYKYLSSTNSLWKSNVRWESKNLSRKNCKLIAHPDLVYEDETTKTLYVVEVKTTKFSFKETRYTYNDQLYIEQILAQERANELGSGWKVNLALCVYSTEGLDIKEQVDFDPSRLTIKNVKIANAFEIAKAMDMVNGFLETFNEYYEGEEVDAEYLPESVKTQFSAVATCLKEIKERERKVEDFKKKLYAFLTERGIKKVACDDFSFTVVEPSESVSFDSKRYIESIMKEHPRKARKILNEYKKVTQKSGYVLIKNK